jgi:hypothetical protein
MNEYHGLASREYKVWPTGKATASEAIAQATFMEFLAHEQLKRSVLPSDALHAFRSLFLVERVYHRLSPEKLSDCGLQSALSSPTAATANPIELPVQSLSWEI